MKLGKTNAKVGVENKTTVFKVKILILLKSTNTNLIYSHYLD
jgi:hypothetical protein